MAWLKWIDHKTKIYKALRKVLFPSKENKYQKHAKANIASSLVSWIYPKYLHLVKYRLAFNFSFFFFFLVKTQAIRKAMQWKDILLFAKKLK